MSNDFHATPDSLKGWKALEISYKPFKLADLQPGQTLVFADEPLILSAPASAAENDHDADKPK